MLDLIFKSLKIYKNDFFRKSYKSGEDISHDPLIR